MNLFSFYISIIIYRIKYFIYNIFVNLLLVKFYNFYKYKSYYILFYRDNYIKKRVDYYNKINLNFKLKPYKSDHSDIRILSNLKNAKYKFRNNQSAYLFDYLNIAKYYDSNKIISILPGDVVEIQNQPTLVKTRKLDCDNSNNILCKFNKIRHFHLFKDYIVFENKINKLVYRGGINRNNNIRRRFKKMFTSNKFMNIDDNYINPAEMTKYKFILSLEGNDVATNLKWIMNTNSLCFMPKPTVESWFMEGTLIPNFHYVLIKDNFSDLINKIKYYSLNTDESLKIIKNANNYVEQFKDLKREHIIEVLVLDKYLKYNI